MPELRSLSTIEQLNQVLEVVQGQPILLDFSAIWCGPCRMLTPKLEDLAEKYSSIPFFKIDTDEAEKELVEYFQVQALPTVIIIANQSVVFTMQGARLNELTLALEKIVQ